MCSKYKMRYKHCAYSLILLIFFSVRKLNEWNVCNDESRIEENERTNKRKKKSIECCI